MDARMKWGALNKRNQEKLLEKHRDINVYHGWWDSVREMLEQDMQKVGVTVTGMYFSGFWSQGDGAEFHGYINSWAEFLTAVGKTDLIDFALEHSLRLSWSNPGRYSGADCVDFDLNKLWVDNPYDEDDEPVRFEAWQAVHGEGGALYQAREAFTDYLKDRMRQLYRDLEEEYEYLTSDESVTDYLIDFREEIIDEMLQEQLEDEEVAA